MFSILINGSHTIPMKPPENDMSQWVSRCHTSATQLRCGSWSLARTVFGGGGSLYSYGTRGNFRAARKMSAGQIRLNQFRKVNKLFQSTGSLDYVHLQ